MISKIGIRQFAVEQAVAIMGTGTPQKDVVAKAAEIEAYVVCLLYTSDAADEL